MSHKKTLLIVTILLAVVSIHFWRTETNASQANVKSLQPNLPTIAFTQSSIHVVEPDAARSQTITVTVVINNAPEQGEEAKVTGLSANASALAGVDYQAVAEYLTFPAGSTNPQGLTVVIIGNDLRQPDREFVVFLTNPENATVGPPASVTIHIIDNDPAPPMNFLPIVLRPLEPFRERHALVALYNNTDGENWRNNAGWLGNGDHCDWYGVNCSNRSVTGLHLVSNQLEGSIPRELGQLSNLETLWLHNNQLSGPIPKELVNLSRMKDISFFNNQLSCWETREVLQWAQRLCNDGYPGRCYDYPTPGEMICP